MKKIIAVAFSTLIVHGSAQAGILLAPNGLDFNGLGDSGQTWTGWTWSNNVNTYGDSGWYKNNGVDTGGGYIFPNVLSGSPFGCATQVSIDSTMRAPSTASGNSLRISNVNGSVGNINHGYTLEPYILHPLDTLFVSGDTTDATNRLGFYTRTQGLDDLGWRSGAPTSDYNLNIGTYIMFDGCTSQPNVCEVGGDGHFYHFILLNNDIWYHVVLDRHPQHLRGVQTSLPVDNPYGASGYPYFHHFREAYWNYSASGYDTNSVPVTAWVDEIQVWTQTQPENDISINGLSVGHRDANDRWELSFMDTSWSSQACGGTVGTYEVRWAAAPITNANWPAATPVTPIFFAATGPGAGPGRIRRPNPCWLTAYAEFQLPAGMTTANNKLYFAVMDVSSTAYGDSHNSPSPYVKTIDYNLRPDAVVAGAPPARPVNMTLR